MTESFKDYVSGETLDGDNKYDAGEHGLQVGDVLTWHSRVCVRVCVRACACRRECVRVCVCHCVVLPTVVAVR